MEKEFNLFGHKIGVMPIEKEERLPGEKKAIIGRKEAEKAISILQKYKQGKINLEERIVNEQQWYKLRHWEVMRKKQDENAPEPASAWLFNSIAQKHADVMDNFPEANVLPREKSDEEAAEKLSVILPTVFEQNDFEGTYSLASWDKLKHGTTCYGIFWNNRKDGGVGDIDIKEIDILNIFWEPGISDIQDSSNLFIVSLKNTEDLERAYPFLKNRGGGMGSIALKDYVHDDAVDISDKTAVIDWYYKKIDGSGEKLHFAKIACGEVLFASENEEGYEKGWYEHGKYPVVFDTLFPEKGSVCGFGYVSICKDPQMYIDKLSKYMLQNAFMASKVRYMVSDNSGLNEDEFRDWDCDVVHCAGSISEDKAMQIKPQSIGGIYYNLLQFKTDELKETSSNRDFSQGSTASGVTSGAAIAALQEAGNKTSRDLIASSYRAYAKICYMAIELMRQFYDESRFYRICGAGEKVEYVEFSNKNIKEQETASGLERKPIFDIKIKAQRKNPFSKMSQNELAKELLAMGFFNPQNGDQAAVAIELMEFEGKEKIRAQIENNRQLFKLLQEKDMQIMKLGEIIAQLKGAAINAENRVPQGQQKTPDDFNRAR